MSVEAPVVVGVARFIADLYDAGIEAREIGPVVTFEIDPVGGAHAGTALPTAVSVSEIGCWPAIPPHWAHFEETVRFGVGQPNADDCLPGWRRHSRELVPWDAVTTPVQAWLRHVRGLANTAI